MSQLSHQLVNTQCVIESIDLPEFKKIKLLGLGINTGSKISVLRNRSGDVVIAIGNARVSIGRTMAQFLKVRVV